MSATCTPPGEESVEPVGSAGSDLPDEPVEPAEEGGPAGAAVPAEPADPAVPAERAGFTPPAGPTAPVEPGAVVPPLPSEPIRFADAAADPPTVELPTLDVPVVPLPAPRARGSEVGRRVREVAVALAIGLVLLAGSIAAVLFGTSVVEEARAEGDTPPTAPAALTFPGTVTLTEPVVGQPTFVLHTGTCEGAGAYADVREGSVVTVSAADGTELATARLGAGVPSPVPEPVECSFPFRATDVAPGPAFYLIEVGQHGAVTYTADDLLHYGATLDLDE